MKLSLMHAEKWNKLDKQFIGAIKFLEWYSKLTREEKDLFHNRHKNGGNGWKRLIGN